MGFEHRYRLSAHAVIVDNAQRVLLLKATYGEAAWGLPGGALDPGETLDVALMRECREELGCPVVVNYLSGVYYHSALESHAAVFSCSLPAGAQPLLGPEHSEYGWFSLTDLAPVQQTRVRDCLSFRGDVQFRRF